MTPEDVEGMVTDALPDADVDVVEDDHEDERSEGAHFGLVVVSDEFEGMSRVDRHRAVHNALDDTLGDEIHAVEIRAETRDEADG